MKDIYFIYGHFINNKIFYVGLGKKPLNYNGHRTEFSRAYAKCKRNNLWYSIVISSQYTVRILFDNLTHEDGISKEADLILQYGLILNGGLLSNFNNPKGEKIRQQIQLKITQYSIDGIFLKTWQSPMQIELNTGFLRTNIIKCCRKKQVTAYGFKWAYSDILDYENIQATSSRQNKNIDPLKNKRQSKKNDFNTTVIQKQAIKGVNKYAKSN